MPEVHIYDRLYPFQREMVDKFLKIESVLCGDQMGAGKSSPINEPVLTESGWVPIGSLKIGDYVIGADGKNTKVIGVYPQGLRKVYKMIFSDNTFVRCDEEHLWAVRSANDKFIKKPYKIYLAKTLKALGLKDAAGNNKFYVPSVQPVQFKEKPITLDPYLVGVLIGDGCLSHHINLSTDHEIVKAINWPDNVTFKLKKDSGYSGDYGISGLIDYVRELGLFPSVSNNKFIPDNYKWGSVETRYACLQGILDTDGTYSLSRGKPGTSIEYGTVSKQLALDVDHIVRSLGGFTSITEKLPTYDYKDEQRTGQLFYRMIIRLPSPFVPFRLKRKLDNWIPRSKYEPTRAIVGIVEDGIEECVCIAVDAKDSLYVTRNFTVTHNTLEALALDVKKREMYPNWAKKGTLIITPHGVIKSWVRHIKEYTDASVVVIDKRDREPFIMAALCNEYDYYICHWESIRLMPDLKDKKWFNIIADECLVRDTKIDTPNGQKNIQDLKIGDTVYGYDHEKQQVVETEISWSFENITNSELYNINNIVMTGNHPIWVEKSGYISASTLDSMEAIGLRLVHGDSDTNLRVVQERILCTKEVGKKTPFLWSKMLKQRKRFTKRIYRRNENLRMVQREISSQALLERKTSVLQSKMFEYLDRKTIGNSRTSKTINVDARKSSSASNEIEHGEETSRSYRKIESAFIFGKQPTKSTRSSTQGNDFSSRTWLCALKWWYGKIFYPSTNVGFEVGMGNGNTDYNWLGQRSSLYVRYSRQSIKNSNRSRRTISYGKESSRIGLSERSISKKSRLENISFHQQRSNVRPRSLRTSSVKVYNIETGTGNYFANGLLVHNCHKIQERKTKASIALKKIPTHFKIGLSGTPAYDKPDDLWSVLNWLYPKQWSSYWKYFDQYVLWVNYKGYKEVIGVQHEEELQKYISTYYIRRKKEDVLKDLPPVYHTEYFVDLDPKQRRAYNAMRDDMLAWIGQHEDQPVQAPVVIVQLTRLMQLACAFGELDENGKVHLTDPSSKIDAILEILDSTDEKIVVFSQFSKVIDLLCVRLDKVKITNSKYTGDTKQSDRDRALDNFIAGKSRVFACTLGAGGTGIDGLQTVSNTAIFIDRDWSHSINNQAVGRLDRIGQNSPVQIIDLIAANTIDSKRMSDISFKWDMIKKLLGES